MEAIKGALDNHGLVWAKVGNHPFWPARVTALLVSSPSFPILYLSSHNFLTVAPYACI